MLTMSAGRRSGEPPPRPLMVDVCWRSPAVLKAERCSGRGEVKVRAEVNGRNNRIPR